MKRPLRAYSSLKEGPMNKRWILIGLMAVLLTFAWGVWDSKQTKPAPEAQKTEAKSEVESYWTCPMHPQIRSDKLGECPICHMKLVQVKAQGDKGHHHGDSKDARSPVVASDYQLTLAGVQKVEVETMDLKVKIPVAGRFISSSAVAFQIYESDLRDIKPGLSFKGESSFRPDDEVTGVISSVDSIVDPTSRTVRVVGAVKNGPRDVLSETSFRGEIEIDLKNRLAIPESSVLRTGQGSLVYLVDKENRLVPKNVKLGLKADSFFEVIEGLSAGDVISSGPNFLIDSESRIRGVFSGDSSSGKTKVPSCPDGQHWDIPMAMCMPGSG